MCVLLVFVCVCMCVCLPVKQIPACDMMNCYFVCLFVCFPPAVPFTVYYALNVDPGYSIAWCDCSYMCTSIDVDMFSFGVEVWGQELDYVSYCTLPFRSVTHF